MALNITATRDLLQGFEFAKLFVEELGWSLSLQPQALAWEVDGNPLERRQIAQLSGVVVLEIRSLSGPIPDRKTLAAVHKEISQLHHENLLIFTDRDRMQSLWYYVKSEDGKK